MLPCGFTGLPAKEFNDLYYAGFIVPYSSVPSAFAGVKKFIKPKVNFFKPAAKGSFRFLTVLLECHFFSPAGFSLKWRLGQSL